jgi:hypothetical protein
MTFLFLLFAPHSFAAPAAKAVPKAAQLAALVVQVQKSPSDDALRRRAIALAMAVKPAPVLPEEAKRRMARGGAAAKGAKDAADWRSAAAEFSAATLAAPWAGDAYYNLGVVQDKAGDYDGALRSLALAELASPGSDDAKNLRYEVEFRRDKASSAAEAANRLLGAVFVAEGDRTGSSDYHVDGSNLSYREWRMSSRVCLCNDTSRCGGPVGEAMDCHSHPIAERRAVWPCFGGSNCQVIAEIAADGDSMTVSTDPPDPLNRRVFRRKR